MARELKVQTDVARLSSGKGESVYFDEGPPRVRVSGLALRVREGGSRKWVYFYRRAGAQRKLTIGDATGLSLDDARREARKQHLLLSENKDPLEMQRLGRQAASTKPTSFKTAVDTYLAVREKELRPRSYIETKRYLERYWSALHALDLQAVDQATVAARLNRIESEAGSVTRNRARSALSALFGWARAEGMVTSSGCDQEGC